MSSVHFIYASTSGHTEHVVDALAAVLKIAGVNFGKQRAELAKADDLLRGDVLILASSTWNTGNVEGQLNPHMWSLLLDRAKAVDLAGKKVACIALGDERYFYTANAALHLEAFVEGHGGSLICPTLKIINEPYGQEAKVKEWAAQLLKIL
jgi:flavodoxin I